MDYPTPVGPAHLAMDCPSSPRAVLVVGHGAGGDIDAPDLLAVRAAALALDVAVVRVRQPYRVAGRRAPAPAAQLDAAFAAVLAGITGGDLPGLGGLGVLAGGRSSGARVAARTAAPAGCLGVLALAFPLCPPGRPAVTRIAELADAGLPALVVQGARDAFGGPDDIRRALAETPAAAPVTVVTVPGADHSFRTRKADGIGSAEALAVVSDAVGEWLTGVLPS